MDNNKTIIFSGLTFLVGIVIGGIAGYSAAKSKANEDLEYVKEELEETKKRVKTDDTKDEKPVEESHTAKKVLVKAAKIATPEEPGINYTAYVKKVQEEGYKAEAESPTEEDYILDEEEDGDEDLMETYEERMLREDRERDEADQLYRKKEGNKIKPLGNNPIDNDYPDVHYPGEELYYFTEDDCLTDEFGTVIENEEDIIGNKLRKYGWMQNSEEAVWVRNNRMEVDYHVVKQRCARSDWFDTEEVKEDE